MATKEEEMKINPDEIKEKLEKERNLRGFWAGVVFLLAIILSLFHYYTSGFGVLLAMRQRAMHLLFIFPLAFILYPSTSAGKNRVPFYDVLMALGGVAVSLYIMMNYQQIAIRAGAAVTMDLVMGGLAILLLLEATRRSIGIALPIIAGIFLVYAFLGPHMPGALAHRGFSLRRVISHLYLTTEGIFGIPIGVSATFVFMFVLFGAFLEQSGIGDYLMKVVFAGLGHQRGGPAKAAVVTSGCMGMISGSSIANTVTTGALTIPIMKKLGFKPEVAGGIEVAASTNGQFLPPIMGAAAFIMVEFTGIPYVEIIKAAFIPAILSYVAIFGIVHIESIKTGIKGMDRSELSPFIPTFFRGAYFLIPIIGLVYLLVVKRMTPLGSAYWGVNLAVAVGIIVKIILYIWGQRKSIDPNTVTEEDLPLDPTMQTKKGVFSLWEVVTASMKEIVAALDSGARNMVGIAMACGCAGIIIGVVTLTGLGLRMTSLIITLARGNVFLTLLLTMFASLILGLGLPTTAKYIIIATLTAPALTRLGVPLIAAHLFVLYFGVLADDTPPVGLAAYAAAAVAKSDPVRTGILGFKFDMAAFILPFIFVYSPMMLMIDVSWYKLIWIVVTAVIGMFAWSAGIQNFMFTKTNILERAGLLIFAVLSTVPNITLDLLGLAGILVIFLYQRRKAELPLIPFTGKAA